VEDIRILTEQLDDRYITHLAESIKKFNNLVEEIKSFINQLDGDVLLSKAIGPHAPITTSAQSGTSHKGALAEGSTAQAQNPTWTQGSSTSRNQSGVLAQGSNTSTTQAQSKGSSTSKEQSHV
jgi:hypothetical protein